MYFMIFLLNYFKIFQKKTEQARSPRYLRINNTDCYLILNLNTKNQVHTRIFKNKHDFIEEVIFIPSPVPVA